MAASLLGVLLAVAVAGELRGQAGTPSPAGPLVIVRALDAGTGEPVPAGRFRLCPAGEPATGPWTDVGNAVETAAHPPEDGFLLEVLAPGYVPAARSLRGPLPARIEIRLERAILRLPDVETTIRRSTASGNRYRWEPAETTGPGLDGWLRTLPGVSVRARGEGGERLVSVRGSRPQAVRVLLDGIPVVDPLRGTADLSLLPGETIGSATLSAGAGTGSAGWGGTAGTLALESRRPEPGVRARLTAGSFGRWDSGLDAGWEAGPLRVGVLARGETARNDFLFANRIVPGRPDERRRNADRDAWNLLARAELGERITLLGRADGVARGAPGRMGNHVWDEARWTERRRSLGLRWTPRPDADVVLAWSDLATEFRDPRTSRRNAIDGSQWIFRGDAPLPRGVRVSWEASWTGVRGDAFPDGETRRTVSARLDRSFRLSDGLTVEPSAALDVAREGAVVSPGMIVRWDATPEWSLWWRAAQARRLPTFADVALDPGTGARPNPDLVPERVTLDAESGVQWRASATVVARASAFVRRTRFPILWLPSVVGIWSPSNLGRLDAFGLETAAEWSPAPGWSVDARFTWQRSRVGFDNGAVSAVPYEPALSGGIGLRGGTGRRSVSVDLGVVGRRHTSVFGPHDLPPYALLDIRGRQAFTFMGRRIEADVGLLNALGSTYERVELFPEPGRRIELALSFSFGPSRRLPDGGSTRSFAGAHASDAAPSSGAGAPTSQRP